MVMKRFRRIPSIIIAAVLLLYIVPSAPVLAQGNNTLVENLTLYPAFQHISVYSDFSGDLNGNSQTLLEYRQVGSPQWIQGTDLYRDIQEMMYLFPDSSVLSPNPYFNQWRAVLFGLQSNTQYEIRVTYTDPDGVSGTNPRTATITTRDDNPPSNGTIYYVSTSEAS